MAALQLVAFASAVSAAAAGQCSNTDAAHVMTDGNFAGKNYYKEGILDSFEECANKCIAKSMTMVTVTSEAQNSYLLATFGSIWLGLYQDASVSEEAWNLWTSGCTSSYSNWASDEPKHGCRKSRCVAMNGNTSSSFSTTEDPDAPQAGQWMAKACYMDGTCVCESPTTDSGAASLIMPSLMEVTDMSDACGAAVAAFVLMAILPPVCCGCICCCCCIGAIVAAVMYSRKNNQQKQGQVKQQGQVMGAPA